MTKHCKVYIKAHKFDEGDFISCQVCGAEAVDIHHVIYKSQGGKDVPDNLIALCKYHHDKEHGLRRINAI